MMGIGEVHDRQNQQLFEQGEMDTEDTADEGEERTQQDPVSNSLKIGSSMDAVFSVK